MLVDLQTARPGGPMDGDDDDDIMSQLDQLGDLTCKQQQLRDRTFRQGALSAALSVSAGSAANAASRVSPIWASCAATSRRCASSANKLMQDLRRRGHGRTAAG